MAFFRRTKNSDPGQLQAALSGIAPLKLGPATLAPRVLAAGLRGKTAVAGVEMTVGEHVGWFRADDVLKFATGGMSILESWNDSPAEMFVSLGAAGTAGSHAAEAMAHVAADQAAILVLDDAGMRSVAVLDAAQQDRLRDWADRLPRS